MAICGLCAVRVIGQNEDRLSAIGTVDCHPNMWSKQVWYQAVVGPPCRNGKMSSSAMAKR